MRPLKSYRTHIVETLRLAGPIAFAQVAYQTMALVDMAIVGRISSGELAVVSIGNALLFAVMCPITGIAMAIEPMASQAIGAKDPLRAWRSLQAGLASSIVMSMPLLLAATFSPTLLVWLGVDRNLLPTATRFILARLPSIPLWMIFLCLKSYLEARGHVKPLTIVAVIANIVNLVACLFLALGSGAFSYLGISHAPFALPALGAFGAGIATTFANLTLVLGALYAAHRARPTAVTWFAQRDALIPLSKQLIRVGLPIGLHFLTEFGVFGLSTLLAGRMGATTVAAHQIALGLSSFTFMVVIGVGNATAVRVGRAVGAQDPPEVFRAGIAGIGMGAAYMSACGLLFLTLARPLAQLFTSNRDLIETACVLIRIAAVFQIADGVQGVAAGALRGRSDTTFAFVINFVSHWFIGLPLALYLAFQVPIGVEGLWWGLTAGLYIAGATLVTRFTLTSQANAFNRPLNAPMT